ncbi:MAG: hypothetical protein IT249_07825 [Chitinophagaceae bacterium]|nr:hypothetical protein [Chitinophagaceae bacterium]
MNLYTTDCMLQPRLEYLFGLYLPEKISKEENAELMHLIADIDNKDIVLSIIDKLIVQINPYRKITKEISGKILRNILKKETN